MNIGNRASIFTLCFIVILLAGGCSKERGGDSGELEAEIARLQRQMLELEAELAGGEDNEPFFVDDFEAYYETLLRELFTGEELEQLALDKGLAYSLKVNDIPVTSRDVLVKADDLLQITVSELLVMQRDGVHTLLPDNVLLPVMLDDLSHHIEIVEAAAEFFDSPASGGIGSGYGFFFENAAAGSTINVKISETLRSRLGLDFLEFTVRVE